MGHPAAMPIPAVFKGCVLLTGIFPVMRSGSNWRCYLGMTQEEADGNGWRGEFIGDKLKQSGTALWSAPNSGATNESGFTALPAASRQEDGHWEDLGDRAEILDNH